MIEQVAPAMLNDAKAIAEAVTLLPMQTPADGEAGALPRPCLEPGELPKVPGFTLLRELGRGGMGVVYLAQQWRLNRQVALKMIISGAHACLTTRQRFLAEAEAIASVQHPGIVQIYEFGMCEEKPYFAMEYVGGGSLEKVLSGSPLHPVEAADLVQKLARAVQVAHHARFIHRDLKPANILLCDSETNTEDSSDQRSLRSEHAACRLFFPKITDFGLVKQHGNELTATGAIMGTPSYMAPEQADCKKTVGPPADIYALGAILYECLTGRPPFKAATPIDTIMQVVNDEPVNVRQLQPRTPRGLDLICMKCLQKQPVKRYASAQLLAEDLGRYLSGEPVLAKPPHLVPRTWEWFRRHPWALVNVFVILLTILLSITYGFWTRTAEAQWRQTLMEAKVERLEGRPLVAWTKLNEAAQCYVDPRLYDEAIEILKPGVSTIIQRQRPQDIRAFGKLIDTQSNRMERIKTAQLPEWKQYVPNARQVAFSADRRYVAIAAEKGDAIVLMDAQKKSELHRLAPMPGRAMHWYEQTHRQAPMKFSEDVLFTADGRCVAANFVNDAVQPPQHLVLVWDAASGTEYLRLPSDSNNQLFAAIDGRLGISDTSNNSVRLWQLEPLHGQLKHNGALAWNQALPENAFADHIPCYINSAAQWLHQRTNISARSLTILLFFLPFCAVYILSRQFVLCRKHGILPTPTHLLIGVMVGLLAVISGFLYLFSYFNTLGWSGIALISSINFYLWFLGSVLVGTQLLTQTANAYRVAEFGDNWKDVSFLGLRRESRETAQSATSKTPMILPLLLLLILVITLILPTLRIDGAPPALLYIVQAGVLLFFVLAALRWYRDKQPSPPTKRPVSQNPWWRALGFRKPLIPWTLLLIAMTGVMWFGLIKIQIPVWNALWIAILFLVSGLVLFGLVFIWLRFMMFITSRSGRYVENLVDHSLKRLNRWKIEDKVK